MHICALAGVMHHTQVNVAWLIVMIGFSQGSVDKAGDERFSFTVKAECLVCNQEPATGTTRPDVKCATPYLAQCNEGEA